MNRPRRLAATAAVASLVLLGACAPPEDDDSETTTESGVSASEATSAEDFGGMDALIEAAQEEGTLNVIALPPDWANYGEIIDTFAEKYDIEVNSDQLCARPMEFRQFESARNHQVIQQALFPNPGELGQVTQHPVEMIEIPGLPRPDEQIEMMLWLMGHQ